jgi:hypothetical protein
MKLDLKKDIQVEVSQFSKDSKIIALNYKKYVAGLNEDDSAKVATRYGI